MTLHDIETSVPGPALDAVVHRYYGRQTRDAPSYSTDWEAVSRLAERHNLELRADLIGSHVIVSLFRDGQYLSIGHSATMETSQEQQNQSGVLAHLATRAMLKLLVCRPDLASTTLEGSPHRVLPPGLT